MSPETEPPLYENLERACTADQQRKGGLSSRWRWDNWVFTYKTTYTEILTLRHIQKFPMD